jgi:hypothetical protein
MAAGLQANGVAPAQAHQIAKLPPVGSLFSAFLGYNPMEKLLGSPAKAHVTAAQWQNLTGKTFFPHLISSPFMSGLRIALTASIIMCLIAAWASWLRGGRFVHEQTTETEVVAAFGAPATNGARPSEAPEPEPWMPA